MQRKGLKHSLSALILALGAASPLTACSQGATTPAPAQTDISANVYNLLVKEIFADLSVSAEASEIKSLNTALAGQTPDEKYATLKKILQASGKLYSRLLIKLNALNPPADAKAKHEQFKAFLADLAKSSGQLEQALGADRDALLKSIASEPVQVQAQLLLSQQTYLKPESKTAIQSLDSLGITYQPLDSALSTLAIPQFWEKSDGDLTKAVNQSAESARVQLQTLLQTLPGSNAVASTKPVTVDASLEEQLSKSIQANADAVNAQDVSAFTDSLHPQSQYMPYMPNVFYSMVQNQTRYKLNKITVQNATESTANVLVSRSTTDKSGTSEQEILYSMKKSGTAWKVFFMENTSIKS